MDGDKDPLIHPPKNMVTRLSIPENPASIQEIFRSHNTSRGTTMHTRVTSRPDRKGKLPEPRHSSTWKGQEILTFLSPIYKNLEDFQQEPVNRGQPRKDREGIPSTVCSKHSSSTERFM